MAVPNVFLSSEYLVASSRALLASPTAPAATGGLVKSKALIAVRNPAPSPDINNISIFTFYYWRIKLSFCYEQNMRAHTPNVQYNFFFFVISSFQIFS